jgi:hypothetical protein
MILAFINVNNLGSQNVRTKLMYVPTYNKCWPEDGLMKQKYVAKLCVIDYILMCCD